jgi:hypothetical protein
LGNDFAATTVAPAAPPAAPSSISVPASSMSLVSYTISWGVAAGTVTNYELQECTNPNFSCCMPTCAPGHACIQVCPTSVPTVHTGPELSFTTTKLFSGNDYYYRVRACNILGCSAYIAGSNGTLVQ